MTPPADARTGRRRIGVGAAIVVVLLALAITVGIGILRGAAAPVDVVAADPTATGASVRAAVVYVHVSGAVNAPGLYVLDAQARVIDAVAAAQGFRGDADQQGVNLARPLSDGEQLVVPVVGAVPAAGAASGGEGRVNLNTADAAELDTLPRIGPAMAQRIIAWREANGRFTTVEDLLAVPGVGDKLLETLRPLVTV